MTPRKMRSLGATPQRGTASSPTPRGSAQVLVREDTDVGDDGPDMEDLWLAVREVDAAPHADEGDQEWVMAGARPKVRWANRALWAREQGQQDVCCACGEGAADWRERGLALRAGCAGSRARAGAGAVGPYGS